MHKVEVQVLIENAFLDEFKVWLHENIFACRTQFILYHPL